MINADFLWFLISDKGHCYECWYEIEISWNILTSLNFFWNFFFFQKPLLLFCENCLPFSSLIWWYFVLDNFLWFYYYLNTLKLFDVVSHMCKYQSCFSAAQCCFLRRHFSSLIMISQLVVNSTEKSQISQLSLPAQFCHFLLITSYKKFLPTYTSLEIYKM